MKGLSFYLYTTVVSQVQSYLVQVTVIPRTLTSYNEWFSQQYWVAHFAIISLPSKRLYDLAFWLNYIYHDQQFNPIWPPSINSLPRCSSAVGHPGVWAMRCMDGWVVQHRCRASWTAFAGIVSILLLHDWKINGNDTWWYFLYFKLA